MKPLTSLNLHPASVPRRRAPAREREGLNPFPLHKQSEYERALKLVEPLVSKTRLTRQERDFLEILATIIEKYEEVHFAIDLKGLGGVEVLRHLMEANGLSGADLGRILGSRTQGYPILRGERELSKAQMIRLGEYFSVPPGVFFGGTHID